MLKNESLKIDRWVIFHPYANFSYPYFKIGLCNLFLLKCNITYVTYHILHVVTNLMVGMYPFSLFPPISLYASVPASVV